MDSMHSRIAHIDRCFQFGRFEFDPTTNEFGGLTHPYKTGS